MVVIFIRTLIIFIALVVVMRLMGKRQIGEMQPFELVLTLIIADLACVPMADVSIPLVYGIVGIFALFLLHQIFSLIEQSGEKAKNLISGKPSVVIDKNFETSVKGLYSIGDGASVTRGLQQASANGLSVADSIMERLK